MADLVLGNDFPKIPREAASEQFLPVDRNDVTNLDENHLKNYIIELFQNDRKDKEEQNWVEQQEYNVASYYGLKNEALKKRPWKNASAYPVPLTPTLVDTAWANTNVSMMPDDDKIINAKGIGKEDIRLAPILSQIMSDQVINYTNLLKAIDLNNFRSYFSGTGVSKIITDPQSNIIRFASLDVENVYLPVYAEGMQTQDTDHVIQVVPFTQNDLQIRKFMGVYREPDKVLAGIGVGVMTLEDIMRLKDQAMKQSAHNSINRNIYYLLEVHLTYFPNTASSSTGKTSAGVRPIELIVTISPNGGVIQRIRKARNSRPFAETIPYPNIGRFYGMSMPEKLRNIQEKLDYADKQTTDALDRAISPAMFVESLSTFDADVAERVPAGVYEKGSGKIDFEPIVSVPTGFERQQVGLWKQGQILTGLIDLFTGDQAENSRTLGEVKIRTVRAGVRFKSVLQRFDAGFGKLIKLLYEYDNEYMPRDQKIKLAGYNDFQSIDQLFPKTENGVGLGIRGQFDFSLDVVPVTEREDEDRRKIEFSLLAANNPLVANNVANLWRILKLQAEAKGIRSIETIVSKPKEVDIYSVDEFIQRVMSGQTDLEVRPGIDTDSYVFQLQIFKRSETYFNMTDQQKFLIERALEIANIMGVAERKSALDLEIIKQGAMVSAMQQKGIGMQGQEKSEVAA